ncbi:MAG: methyltransferase domain-containing protein [Calditrichaeota bacterium]|nr:MAG: methyltransferase domain-containing protein [Calditrichota bacterium]
MEVYFFDPYVVKIQLAEGVWKPTPHGIALAKGMIQVPNIFCGKNVIEIGVGSGLHSILAAKLGARNIDVTDISESVLQIALQNAELNGVQFRHAWIRDWMDFVPSEPYDTILCNPPFCKAGTSDRRWFIKELIRKSPSFLRPGGYLIFCQSSMADFRTTEIELKEQNFMYETVYLQRNLFRDYYFTEPGFIQESQKVEHGFEIIDGEYVETLKVYLGTLRS